MASEPTPIPDTADPGPARRVRSDQARTRQALERLLDQGLLATPVAQSGVRDVIERSWRRCVGAEVPIGRHDIPYVADVHDIAPRLHAAAAPVLDRLGDDLGDARVAMFLSDDQGRIIMRRAGESQQLRTLDDSCAAEGFDFSETSIGTNGLGTVARERRPLLVHGSEHYNELLGPLTCAGTPIFEPFTQQLLGTFALACRTDQASPLMTAMATDVGRQIEGNLTAMLGAHERMLIQAFLLATRSERQPVIVVTENTAFGNTAGLVHVTPETHALLWCDLVESGLRAGRHRRVVQLASGRADALVERVEGVGPTGPAFCVRLLDSPRNPERDRTPPSRRARRSGTAPALLHPLADISEQLRTAVGFGEVLAVDGPAGSGKLTAATAALAERTGSPPLLIDLARAECPKSLAETGAIAVVLHHVHDASGEHLRRVRTAIEDASVPVALTVDLDTAHDGVAAVVAALCTTVRLPSLPAMSAEVPRLVTRIVAGLPPGQRDTRFTSDALQALIRWSWPGNLAELRRTVEQLARRRPGRSIGTADLPPRMQQAALRGRGMIETAERDAIITALHRAGGNRTKAAAALGIGRTTLYRKLQEYRIPSGS
ncbi:sigma-54-dependent Fis family transcriptional regulator [Pseudonocardia abyssalis]|uniref:GAF domain-containing protein n=1 Tax=Pseudonocardia abyssalis TaxID=2792008 RepID=A0ABS6UYD7_9PSEU|nr:helix-turn-helix domain-containing protein [Pseudonocardia abyssalis]MBW0114251.1 GAF domain-containing protein [Pseudonocardia abyssalis]MBW0137275.1 GAF domain-containing protein [Pseudonocardia abyssalis]